jgi:hypothetical protein
MRYVALKLVVPVVLGLSLGDVSPAGATFNETTFGMHAAGCRGKTANDQKNLLFHKYYGLYNNSTTEAATVVCPMGSASGGTVTARVRGWRDNLKPFKCYYFATDAWGTKVFSDSLLENASGLVDLKFSYSSAGLAYGYAECVLTTKVQDPPPAGGGTGSERFAFLSSVTTSVGP